MRLTLTLLVGILSVPSLRSEPPAKHFDGNSWWSHVKILADDKMEGRQTGSEGLRKAEAYVVEQLKHAGLEPAGENGGYYQRVPFVQRQIVEEQSAAALVHAGVVEPLELGVDAFFGRNFEGDAGEVTAPLVFIGNGLRVPEAGVDDLAGLDVKGKIVVYIAGSPTTVSAALTGHYGSAGERWKLLRAAGAIGAVAIPNPASMDIPWIRMTANRTAVTMEIADTAFDETTGQKVSLTFNPAQAEKLFTGSGHTFRELAILAKDRAVLPHFPLAVSLKTHATVREAKLESANLVARLPGSDSILKDEFVVMSAHIDHVGIGAAINGDKIYNGAMDNASGSAMMLDVATSLKASGEKLRRSLLIVFVCAEEKGLLGSKFFATRPTVPARGMVANINTDMFLPIAPAKTLTVKGLAESDLGELVVAAARAQSVNPIADPEPLRNLFVRSDQYSFIRQGIPSINFTYGAEPGTSEAKIFKDWLTERYHAPSDDLNQPVDLAAAATFEEIMRAVVLAVANGEARPQWKPDSFFRRYAKK